MLSRLLVTLLVCSCSLPSTIFAQEKNKLEKKYWNWGLGYAGISYPSSLGETLSELKNSDGISRVSLSIDLFGFYKPRGEHTLIGGTANGFGDAYQVGEVDLQITGVTLAFSVMHFLNDRIGKGPFIRADLGPAALGIEVIAGRTSIQSTSDLGLGALLGGGFGVPISSKTRILFNINYAIRAIQGDTYKNLGLAVSGLF